MLNARQKWGIGLILGGVGSILTGVFGVSGAEVPSWLPTVFQILGTILPSIGVVVNFPSSTGPK